MNKPLTIEISCTDLSIVNRLFKLFIKYESQLPEPMIKEIEALAIEAGV